MHESRSGKDLLNVVQELRVMFWGWICQRWYELDTLFIREPGFHRVAFHRPAPLLGLVAGRRLRVRRDHRIQGGLVRDPRVLGAAGGGDSCRLLRLRHDSFRPTEAKSAWPAGVLGLGVRRCTGDAWDGSFGMGRPGAAVNGRRIDRLDSTRLQARSRETLSGFTRRVFHLPGAPEDWLWRLLVGRPRGRAGAFIVLSHVSIGW